jgi:hypothetical protein
VLGQFSKAQPWSPAIFVDELDTALLKGGAYLLHGCHFHPFAAAGDDGESFAGWIREDLR